jgi:hypothetical protein
VARGGPQEIVRPSLAEKMPYLPAAIPGDNSPSVQQPGFWTEGDFATVEGTEATVDTLNPSSHDALCVKGVFSFGAEMLRTAILKGGHS